MSNLVGQSDNTAFTDPASVGGAPTMCIYNPFTALNTGASTIPAYVNTRIATNPQTFPFLLQAVCKMAGELTASGYLTPEVLEAALRLASGSKPSLRSVP